MNKILVLFTLTCHLASAATVDQTARAAELIRTTKDAISEKYRDPALIVEMRSSLKKIEAFGALQTAFSTSWKETLSAIGTVAPDDPSIAIYFKAAEVLPKREYVGFMLAAADGVTSGKISVQQFKWGLFPSEKHLRDMWNEDGLPPAIFDLARKAKTLLADEPETVQFFEGFLAGKVADGATPPSLSSSFDSGSSSQNVTKPISSTVESATLGYQSIVALVICGLAVVLGFVALRIYWWRKNA